jgi:ABC-type antimicrobial peptide transport system permease subunit
MDQIISTLEQIILSDLLIFIVLIAILALSPNEFIQAFAVALLAALVAGMYPAWRLSKLVTARALRNE